MRSAEVDAYVKNKVENAEQALALEAVRSLMEKHAPQVDEIISYGQPTWKGNKMVLTVKPSKSHLTVVFSRGADITDKHGLLAGTGNTSKHLKVAKATDIDPAIFRDYLTQAIALDA